ncbi:transposase IS66 [Burkholderia lata]|uniref:Transposase IS66 n=1 Tax=Burkholderia lata (strain ATCC 17760 / DSM 23089 / LMG 22485 / NCIMB 9086 / R18194 / 383) TaxID=482957 RepID=A0A6P2KY71_BURL3|nr:transposase IS66 [Burkholderia lata]
MLLSASQLSFAAVASIPKCPRVAMILLGKGLTYLRSQWPKLIRCVENGDWPISNNPCENAIQPFCVGRRGWLFSDTVDGVNASANLYSLVETCKANGIDPYRYLTWLFQRLPLATTVDDYYAPLPWKMPATCADPLPYRTSSALPIYSEGRRLWIAVWIAACNSLITCN